MTGDQALQVAVEHMQSGRLADAERICRGVLDARPAEVDALHLLGVIASQRGDHAEAISSIGKAAGLRRSDPSLHNNLGNALVAAGKLDEAERSYRRALTLAPGWADAHNNLGKLLFERGNFEGAVACCRRALAIERDNVGAHNNLGNALKRLGRLDDAEASYRRALELAPDDAELHSNLGSTLNALGRLAEAEASLQHALALRPDLSGAHFNLGDVQSSLGRPEDAERSYRRAAALDPRDAAAHYNLGNALLALRRTAEAEASYRRMLEIAPHSVNALCNLGAVLVALGRHAEAEAKCREALHFEPRHPESHVNLGNALHGQGRLAEAEACLRHALVLAPDSADAHNNFGNVLIDTGRTALAAESYRRAVALRPAYHEAHGNLANALKDLGHREEAEASLRRALEIRPDHLEAHGNLLFLLNYDPDRSAGDIFDAYRQFDARFGAPLRAHWQPHGNERTPARSLRVGYVSPDFRNHACRYFIEPLLARHDPSAVEVFAYADVPVEDAVSARIRSHVQHRVPTVGMSDEQLAARIRADRIDILVDLAGHTRGNRLLVFARKPAPVSVSMLGFGTTTGLPAIDWFLTDALVVPEGSEELLAEKPWRLPECLVYRANEGMGEVSPLPALARGHVVFGTLTRVVRINHLTLDAWSELLRRVPRSVLRIDSSNFTDAGLCASLSAQFAERGIGAERLQIGFHTPPWDVLRDIDIGLDCFPHNSGTTLFETLYMGVPFVTVAARPPVGRLGSSILTHAGHPEWIAADAAEYVDKAAALAADLPRLAGLRARLRPEMQAGLLMDEAGYARKVESAYRQMWRRWCESTPVA